MELFQVRTKTKQCCVPGCNDYISKRHRFPKTNLTLFDKWVKAVANPKINKLESVDDVYKSYYVCDRHFCAEFLNPGSKRGLTLNAFPTLYLPGVPCDTSTDEQILADNIDMHQDNLPDVPQPLHSFLNQQGDTISSKHGTPLLNIEEPTPSTSKECDISLEQGNVYSKKTLLSKGIRKRHLILQTVNASRRNDLTPKCRRFYKMVIDCGNKAAKLQHKVNSYQKRVAIAERVAHSGQFQKLLQFVNPATYNFIMQQLRTQPLIPRARRFSIDEKIFALTILKASGKAYRLLSKVFALPSRRTLTNLLNKLPFKSGINKQIFNTLKETVKKMKPNDRCCVLLFDEISIDANLSYNKKDDTIDGFEDQRDSQNVGLADYANVFMVKGINRQWKQPIAFTFSSGPVKFLRLKKLIIDIISSCHQIGLEVVGTICDQGSANRAAINSLLHDTNEYCIKNNTENKYVGYLVDKKEIVPLYDIPHLFKGIRNNLLTKDLHFTLNNEEKIAKWKHIEDFYFLDISESTRICPKLSDGHVLKDKINKMKVSHATQVFSHQVGSLMLRISKWGINSELKLDANAAHTAELLLFLDQLFDSMNGNNRICPASKPLKGGVTKKSAHREFWQNSLGILGSMRFYCHKKKDYVSNPTIANLIKTIRGFIYITDKLLKNNFSYVLPRAFNQDPLENFFGAIRSHGVRNVSPTVPHFISSFKALLVNNFMSTHSPGNNCEEDVSCGTFDNLRCFLTGEHIAGITPLMDDGCIDTNIANVPLTKKTRVGKCIITYVAGYVAKKVLQLNNCEHCKQCLLHSDGTPMDTDFIEARQYNQCTLIAPGTFLNFVTGQILSKLFYLIPRLCSKECIAILLNKIILNQIDCTPLYCPNHNIGKQVVVVIVKMALYFWCKRVNCILKGKDAKFTKFMNSNRTVAVDPIKLLAHKKYLSKCKK